MKLTSADKGMEFDFDRETITIVSPAPRPGNSGPPVWSEAR